MTNEEIIKSLRKKIFSDYDGIVSKEVIQASFDWWEEFLKKVLETKDTQHKADIQEILESVPAKGVITPKGTLCVFRKDLEEWKQQIRKKYLDK